MIHTQPVFRAVTSVDKELRAALLTCWVDVTNAGGAVGFLPPADPSAVAAALDGALAEVAAGTRWLGVVRDADGLAAFGFVVPQRGAVVGHRATVLSAQVHPTRQGRGLGRLLMTGLHDLARGRGITRVTLWYRSGLGLGAFYRSIGYREVGRWPRTLRVAEDDWRDDVWMAADLV